MSAQEYDMVMPYAIFRLALKSKMVKKDLGGLK